MDFRQLIERARFAQAVPVGERSDIGQLVHSAAMRNGRREADTAAAAGAETAAETGAGISDSSQLPNFPAVIARREQRDLWPVTGAPDSVRAGKSEPDRRCEPSKGYPSEGGLGCRAGGADGYLTGAIRSISAPWADPRAADRVVLGHRGTSRRHDEAGGSVSVEQTAVEAAHVRRYAIGGGEVGSRGVSAVDQRSASRGGHGSHGRLVAAIADFVSEEMSRQVGGLMRAGLVG